jgi:hypothetical protein
VGKTRRDRERQRERSSGVGDGQGKDSDRDMELRERLITVLCPAQEFLLYRDVTFAIEELQNLGLCSTLRAFEQGGIFIMPHLL